MRSPRAGLLVAALVLAADQITKAIARSELGRGEVESLPLGIDLKLFFNDGIAFSLFDGGGVWISVISVIAFAGLIAFLILGVGERVPWLAVGLLAGGALGNLIDRIRMGAVTDFIDPASWPAFNIADVAITVGVAAVVVDQLLADLHDRRATRAQPGGDGPGSNGP